MPRRSSRYLERGKDLWKTVWFSLSAVSNIAQAIWATLQAAGHRDRAYMHNAWQDIIELKEDIVDAVDHGVSWVTWLARETIGAVLQGKSRAIDKINYKRPAKTRLGKTWKHVSNRVLNTLDAGVNTVGIATNAVLDITDVWVAKAADIFNGREHSRVPGAWKKMGNAVASALIELFDEGIYRWTIQGKSRASSKRSLDYQQNARNATKTSKTKKKTKTATMGKRKHTSRRAA